MATQGYLRPTSPTSTDNEGCEHSVIREYITDGKEISVDLPHVEKLTGEIWTLKFECMMGAARKEIVTCDVDKAYVTVLNMMQIKLKFGFSGRALMFYKKRCGSDQARLVELDYVAQEADMLSDNAEERKISFVLTKDQPRALEVSITPMKRPRQRSNVDEATLEHIDAYKEWLAILQHDNPETDLMDDNRDETIKTYKEWLRQQGHLPDILSYLDQRSNDSQRLQDEEIHGSSKSPADWPSHARRHRKKDPASDGCFKKEGRGPLKGIAAATKRITSGDQKLKIEFASKLGGPTGKNARAFVDEVVLFTRNRAPLIGVTKWAEIELDVRHSIASAILQRWDFPSDVDAHEKIFKIAKERYKAWRSTLSSTFRAYNTYDERMRNKPEELDIVEWHYLIKYFGSEKFQKMSSQNSDNRKKQKTKHIMGSKTFSRISYEHRDPQSGEEPSDLSLWMITHMKNDQWSDDASKAVYEDARYKICEKESQTESLWLTTEDQNAIFQSSFKETTGCKANRPYGHGYLSKYQTRATTNQKNIELQGEVQVLKEKLANEVAERERILQEKIQELQEEEDRKRRQLQEEEERKRQALLEEMRKEIAAALAKQRNATTVEQINRESIIPNDLSTVDPTDAPAATLSGANDARTTRQNNRKILSQNSKGNGPGHYISSHSLRNAVTRRVHARSERSELGLHGSDLQG